MGFPRTPFLTVAEIHRFIDYLILLLFLLPLPQGLQFFVKPQVALVAAGLDLPGFQGRQYGAAFFLGVTAIQKAALAQIGPELPEGLRQAALQFQVQLLRFKGGKAR